MAKTTPIKSAPQNWRASGLVISGLAGQKILQFDWFVVTDVDYIMAKELLSLFTIWSTYLLLKISSAAP